MKWVKRIVVPLAALALGSCQRPAEVAREQLAARGLAVTAAEFVHAAEHGATADLPLFLRAGLAVDIAAADGTTPFAAAVGAGRTAAADFLLGGGADVNRRNAAGRTPLLTAVLADRLAAVEYLLAHGADVNAAADGRRTPLAAAASVPVIRALLRAGAAPDERGLQGQPPLVWAAAVGEVALARQLLAAGAAVDDPARAPAGQGFAAAVGDDTLAYYLKKDAGVTPLMLAAGRGDLEMAALLLAHGAKKSRETRRHGSSAVYIACENNRIAVVRLLLGRSADPADYPYEINISLARQRLVVTRGGAAWFRAAVSTGAPGFETPRGKFVITNKYEDWRSTIYDNAPMPFFMRLNCGPVGLHAGALPGYPASHGCIRLAPAAAEKIFNAVDIGTQVTIGD